MLRFATCPYGDMTINDLRIALFNYMLSQQKGESFAVFIEDAQKEKVIEGKDQEILDTLALFSINYSQIIHQSQNVRFHSAMALQLLHEKKAFSCFCSDEWLEKKKQEAREAGKNYTYDDACRNLPAELVIDNTNPFRVRINRPESEITFNDAIEGDVSFSPDAVDSFVIMQRDKTPTQNFAAAVDDMLYDITFILRSKKELENTPRQIHVRNQLGYEKQIQYAHLADIVDAEGNASSLSIKELLSQGYLPEAISNYLISIANNVPREIFTFQEASKWFTLETLSQEATVFDMQRLQYINQQHLKRMEPKELSRYVGFADADIGELAKVFLDEVVTTRELREKISLVFEERKIPKALEKEVKLLSACIVSAPYFEEYEAFKNHLQKESGVNGELFTNALRVLLINTQEGPELAEIYQYIKNYLGEIVKC